MANLVFYLLAACDFIAGATLTSAFPATMWALCGLFMGGTLAFCLEAPVYGLRRQRPLLVGIACLLLLIFAGVVYPFRTMPSLNRPVALPQPPVQGPNFSGRWDTGRWGTMNLVQDGAQVFGNYSYANGLLEGNVTPNGDGTLVLRYRWRNQNRSGNGVGYFTLAADAKSFEGRWTQGENLITEGQIWKGLRMAGASSPPMTFTGLWDTEWGKIRLSQGLNRANGTYEYGGGLLKGIVENKKFRFRWTNRLTGERGMGQFKLATYGKTFEGTWGFGNSDSGGGTWNGSRLE